MIISHYSILYQVVQPIFDMKEYVTGEMIINIAIEENFVLKISQPTAPENVATMVTGVSTDKVGSVGLLKLPEIMAGTGLLMESGIITIRRQKRFNELGLLFIQYPSFIGGA